MGVDDALRAADFVGATKIVGVHYDTFPPIKIDRETRAESSARGRQRITFAENRRNDLVVSAAAYIRGNYSALTSHPRDSCVPQSRYFAFV